MRFPPQPADDVCITRPPVKQVIHLDIAAAPSPGHEKHAFILVLRFLQPLDGLPITHPMGSTIAHDGEQKPAKKNARRKQPWATVSDDARQKSFT